MSYTLRNVPPDLDEALRQRARQGGKSLNDVILETLLEALGLSGSPIRHRDLGDISGTWVEESETEEAFQDQRRLDPEPL
jgi:plasmid stability protein